MVELGLWQTQILSIEVWKKSNGMESFWWLKDYCIGRKYMWILSYGCTCSIGYVREYRCVGRVVPPRIHITPFKHLWIHFYGYGDSRFFVPIYLLLSVKEFLCFEEKQMNDILLEVMEWLIYHSIEIILLILCVIGWKLWWEVSWGRNPCPKLIFYSSLSWLEW